MTVLARPDGPSLLGVGPYVAVPAPRQAQEPRSTTVAGQVPASRRTTARPLPLPSVPLPLRRSWTGPSSPRLVAPPAPSRPATALPVPARRTTATDHLLTLLALLGLAVTALTVVATLVGLRPLVVRSGSMEPEIRTGGMVLVQQVTADEIRVGDVVAVDRPDGVRVTHRVVTAKPVGSAVELVLKGDANDDVDPDPVAVTRAGRVVWSVPLVGRLSSELTSARGGFVLGCLVTAGVLGAVRRPASS